jgi:opacity protein-like surface antigen
MKLLLTALLFTALAAGAHASDSYLVASPHGGYNVIQGGQAHGAIAFFGSHGFAAVHAHDKPSYIIRPYIAMDGHGNKHTVYKKIYFATPEEAEAARGKYY